ncbi:MAG: phosphoglycerate dehydrogenase [Candidatus Bipolaricaulota bacterium]
MRIALVSSRSFGQVVSIGEELLSRGGFDIRRVPDSERPLDAPKLARLVARERPAALIAGAEPVPREVLEASPTLRLVQKHGVGVDNIDLEAATRAGIAVTNAPGTNTEAVADLAVGFMLALLRQIAPASASTRAGKWDRYMGRELGRLTVGVIGTGRIGRAVIRRLSGFGSAVLAYDVIQDWSLVAAHGVRYAELEEVLEASDVVTLHIPLMDETREMIGPQELQRMKPTAYLINIARGELVNERALAEHLAAGRIAGAGVDVFSTEPPQKSPLLSLPNVLATPHIGAYTEEAMEAMDRMCAETVVSMFSGGPPERVVNPDVLERWSPLT